MTGTWEDVMSEWVDDMNHNTYTQSRSHLAQMERESVTGLHCPSPTLYLGGQQRPYIDSDYLIFVQKEPTSLHP